MRFSGTLTSSECAYCGNPLQAADAHEAPHRVPVDGVLPFLVDRQSSFCEHNFAYVHDERVSLVQGDGRHDLAASSRRYDIISTNVLDPYLPGSSSLYTVEFWQLVAERLKPGGVFTQLFWGEDL